MSEHKERKRAEKRANTRMRGGIKGKLKGGGSEGEHEKEELEVKSKEEFQDCGGKEERRRRWNEHDHWGKGGETVTERCEEGGKMMEVVVWKRIKENIII